MPHINVDISGDHAKIGREVIGNKTVLQTDQSWTIDPMEHGMQSGATSIALLIPVNIEEIECVVVAETSLKLFMQAATILAAKFRSELKLDEIGWTKMSDDLRAALSSRYAEAIRRATACTPEKALEAANMILDVVGADAPPDWWVEG